MLHKVSSLKMGHHSINQGEQGWESLRKGMASPRQVNNVTSGNINEKMTHLIKMIENEKASRQKDFLALNDKIKNLKCKHQVIYVDSKDRNRSVDQNVQMLNKRCCNHQNADVDSHSEMKELQIEKLLKQNKNMKLCLEKISEECSFNSTKIEEIIDEIKNVNGKNQTDELSMITLQIEKLKSETKEIPSLKEKLNARVMMIEEIAGEMGPKGMDRKIEELQSKFMELEEALFENLKSVEMRSIGQIETLGSIVDKNLENIHKNVIGECIKIGENCEEKLREEFLNSNLIGKINGRLDEMEENRNERDLSISQTVQSLEISLKKNILDLLSLSEKITQVEELVLEQPQKISFLVETESEKQKSLMRTHESISNEISHPFDTNESDQTQKSELEISEGEFTDYQKGLDNILELVSENCSFLESRNIGIEESMREMVELINHILGKLKNYL